MTSVRTALNNYAAIDFDAVFNLDAKAILPLYGLTVDQAGLFLAPIDVFSFVNRIEEFDRLVQSTDVFNSDISQLTAYLAANDPDYFAQFSQMDAQIQAGIDAVVTDARPDGWDRTYADWSLAWGAISGVATVFYEAAEAKAHQLATAGEGLAGGMTAGRQALFAGLQFSLGENIVAGALVVNTLAETTMAFVETLPVLLGQGAILFSTATFEDKAAALTAMSLELGALDAKLVFAMQTLGSLADSGTAGTLMSVFNTVGEIVSALDDISKLREASHDSSLSHLSRSFLEDATLNRALDFAGLFAQLSGSIINLFNPIEGGDVVVDYLANSVALLGDIVQQSQISQWLGIYDQYNDYRQLTPLFGQYQDLISAALAHADALSGGTWGSDLTTGTLPGAVEGFANSVNLEQFDPANLTIDMAQGLVLSYYGTVLGLTDLEAIKQYHYDRNHNLPLGGESFFNVISGDFTLLAQKASIYHMIDTEGDTGNIYNAKFVSGDGHLEYVFKYTEDGFRLVTSPINMGTYNFGDPNLQLNPLHNFDFPFAHFDVPIEHFILDMLPFFLWGNSVADAGKFTFAERLHPDIDVSAAPSHFETVQGSAGDDLMPLVAQASEILGDSGNDVLVAGAQVEHFFGGDGTDLLSYAAPLPDLLAGVVVSLEQGKGYFGNSRDDLISGVENLMGTALHDILIGSNAIGNEIWGGAGRDEIHGLDGNDSLYGGDGDDSLYGDSGNDVLFGGEGSDTVYFEGAFAQYALFRDADSGVHITDALGTAGVDYLLEIEILIFGSLQILVSQLPIQTTDMDYGPVPGLNRTGTAFDDVLMGSAGDDVLHGGADGKDQLYGLSGHDQLSGGFGEDHLYGSTGKDTLYGGEQNDWLEGGAGNDWLDGQQHADVAYGGAGDDYLVIDQTGDRAYGDAGNDTLNALLSDYVIGVEVDVTSDALIVAGVTVASSVESIILTAGWGDDTVLAGFSTDVLSGNVGQDILHLDYSGSTPGGQTATALNLVYGVIHEELVVTGVSIGGTIFYGYTPVHYNHSGATITLSDGTQISTEFQLFEAFDLTATTGNDYVHGRELGDTLRGLGGDDALDGWTGDDSLLAGDGNDSLIGGTGSDTLDGGTGKDTLDGGTGNDLVHGGSGDDHIYIDSAGDRVTGDTGNDVLDLAFSQSTQAANVIFNAGVLLVNGQRVATGAEHVTGILGQGDDTIAVGFQLDVLDGATGANTIRLDYSGTDQAGQGAAAVHLAYGVYHYEPVVTGYSIGGIPFYTWMNVWYDHIGLGVTRADGSVVGTEFRHFQSIDLTATAGDDYAFGRENGDTMRGLAGNDSFYGWTGNDSLIGGNGDDTLDGGAGNDVLIGGTGNDVLIGGAGNDTFILTDADNQVLETTTLTSGVDAGGVDTVQSTVSYDLGAMAAAQFVERLTLTGTGNINGTGNALGNLIKGNSGNNILDGGLGNDTMRGGAGDDVYFVDSLGDRVFETTTPTSGLDAGGTDTVMSTLGLNLGAHAGLASVERLTLIGTGNVMAIGNAMDNLLIGNSGQNFLNGGLGSDILAGGMGKDSFLFSTALATGDIDTIEDFNVVDDTLRLDDAIFTGLSKGRLSADAFAAIAGGIATSASQRIIYDMDTGRVFFDRDGNGAEDGILFAALADGLVLTNADFVIY